MSNDDLSLQQQNALKLSKAIWYLRKEKIYRGDESCAHQYTPHDPELLVDLTVRVTKFHLSTPCLTVNHATYG